VHAYVQQVSDRASQLSAVSESLRQAGATLQTLAAQWGAVEPATDRLAGRSRGNGEGPAR